MSKLDLSSFKPEIVRQPLRFVIHGVGGIGKTTLVSKMRNTIILAAEQGGANMLPVAKAPIKEYRDLIEVLNALEGDPHQFETIGLDTADKMEALITEALLDEANRGSARFKTLAEIPYGKGTALLKKEWEKILAQFDRIRLNRGMTIAIICHSEVRQINDITAGSYHLADLKLNRDVSNYMVEWSDMTLYAAMETFIDGTTGKMMSKNNPVAATHTGRKLYTTPNGAYRAKNRFPGFPSSIDLSYEVLGKCVAEAYARLEATAKEVNVPSIANPVEDTLKNHIVMTNGSGKTVPKNV